MFLNFLCVFCFADKTYTDFPLCLIWLLSWKDEVLPRGNKLLIIGMYEVGFSDLRYSSYFRVHSNPSF
jgi:hypothetical protein